MPMTTQLVGVGGDGIDDATDLDDDNVVPDTTEEGDDTVDTDGDGTPVIWTLIPVVMVVLMLRKLGLPLEW